MNPSNPRIPVKSTRTLMVGLSATLALAACAVTTQPPGSAPTPSTSVVTVTASTAPTNAGPASPASPAAPATPAVRATPAAPATGAATGLPAGGHWLYELVGAATRPASSTSTKIAGDASERVYQQSTSIWAGCDGQTDKVVFKLDGNYRTVRGYLGLREGTPPGVVTRTLFSTENGPIQYTQVDASEGASNEIRILVAGMKTLTLESTVYSGTCTASDVSYLVLGDAYAS